MINVKNSYDTLREVILGDVDLSVVDLIKLENQTKIQYVLEQLSEDLNQIQNILETRGVKVYRPVVDAVNQNLVLPYISIKGQRIPIAPRDHFVVIGDTIVETASWNPSSYFAGSNYKKIFIEMFNRGAKWIAMPQPNHNPKDFEGISIDDIPNTEPMLDAANILLHNNDIFITNTGANNQLGIDWFERHFGDRYCIHQLGEPFIGHIDGHISILQDKVIMTHHDPSLFPKYFSDWDFVTSDTNTDNMLSIQQSFLDGRVQDDDILNSVLVSNSLSIDSKTIMLPDIYQNNQLLMLKKLEQLGIEIVWFPYRTGHFTGNSISCLTTELVRDNNQ